MGDAGDAPLRLRTDDLTWREVGDELVVLKLSVGTYLSLNAVGRELWNQLEGGATAAQLAHSLVETYGISADEATEDVASFLENLNRLELLTGSSTAESTSS
jgi:hypothetical protein